MRIAIGIDIGGTNTKFVLAQEDGTVLSSHEKPTPVSSDKKKKIEELMVDNLKEFLNTDSARQVLTGASGSSSIAGIGIGIAGLIDRKSGKIIQSPNMSALNGVPLKDIFEKEFSLPVVIENDANIYAYGEKWVGAGKEYDNFAVVTLRTGLGGGLIYN